VSVSVATPAQRLDRLRAEGGWYSVDAIARFAITGGDRLRYLNGQVSNDLRKLQPGEAMKACILSARGRLDGVVWVWSEPEALVVECDTALAEPLAMRLERYVVADDVEIAPQGAAAGIHVFGAAAGALAQNPGARKILRLGIQGVDLPAGPAGDLLEATPDEIERLRIEHGVPRWGAELGAETLPAEAGLDRTAVDFHKGCYIGQEVVSRIQSVGHANRALRRFEVLAGSPPAVGTEFFSPGEAERAVATVTSVHFALSPAVGLCYIRRGTSEGAVLTTAAGDSRIQLCPSESSHA
jgi:folate-binding protein YgfZ